MSKILNKIKDDVKTDVTWNRVARLSKQGARALPRASGRYVLEKFPIIEWIPHYKPKWLINDAVAGLTIGLMLIPQGLSYAKIATIPVQYGLMASWLPPLLYAIMGTTKDISAGPTSLIGLLTAEAVADIPQYKPQEVASAMALMMGIYGIVLGFLKLGFLLEFISLPILSGFISAVALTIGLNQMPSLLGEQNVGSGTARQIHDVLKKLPQANGYDCAIGFTGILFLVILEQAGKRWGKKNKVVWFLSITRAFLALVLFTGVSYAVNHKRKSTNYLFGVVQVKSNGIEYPVMPQRSLIEKVTTRGISIFIGAAVEHTAIARAFGVHNNYVPDQTQELCYIGITNFFNSFFHSMGVGGAMSRTSVNSACNVKSPLSGVITSAAIILCIYKLVGALYWIPKATLAAIIICAIAPLVAGPKTFYRYWKTSLADWISSMLAFWVTLFVSTQIGLAVSVGFNVVYFMIRQFFSGVHSISSAGSSELIASIDDARGMPHASQIPSDVRIFRFTDSVFFPNSHRLKTKIMDAIQTCHSPSYSIINGAEAERNWSVAGEKRVQRLRKAAGITDPSTLPPIRLIIIDFTRVNYTDATAVSHLKHLVTEVQRYAGDDVEIRFVGMSTHVHSRFVRANWKIVDPIGLDHIDNGDSDEHTRMFRTVRDAVLMPRRRPTIIGDVQAAVIEAKLQDNGSSDMDVEKQTVTHVEQISTPVSDIEKRL